MTRIRRAASTVMWTVIVSASAASILLFIASTAGLAKGLIVVSGSMEPGIATGSFVVARSVPADTVEVGDVVAVRSMEGTSIIHRVIETEPSEDEPGMTTLQLKGDANSDPDAQLYVTDSVLAPLVIVPGAGHVVAFVDNTKTIVAANPVLVGATVVGLLLLLVATRLGRRAPAAGLAPAGADEQDDGDEAADEQDDAATADASADPEQSSSPVFPEDDPAVTDRVIAEIEAAEAAGRETFRALRFINFSAPTVITTSSSVPPLRFTSIAELARTQSTTTR